MGNKIRQVISSGGERVIYDIEKRDRFIGCPFWSIMKKWRVKKNKLKRNAILYSTDGIDDAKQKINFLSSIRKRSQTALSSVSALILNYEWMFKTALNRNRKNKGLNATSGAAWWICKHLDSSILQPKLIENKWRKYR